MQIRTNVPLDCLSSFRIGGKAKQLIEVSSPEEIIQAVDYARKNNLKFRIFAGGTNIVFPDKGIDYLLIHNKGGSIQLPQTSKPSILADSGVLLMDVVNRANSLGYAGLEKLAGIPGSIGGAVFGNAGAYGQEISDTVHSVEIYAGGRRKWLTKSQCRFSYRSSIFKSNTDKWRACPPNCDSFWRVILRVLLVFQKTAPPSQLKKTSSEIISTREKKYPPGLFCPGSFFKNIKADSLTKKQLAGLDPKAIVYGKLPAGYLLEEVGAKNISIGGIRVSDYHANLICNEGGGTSSEVKKLAQILKEKVNKKFGIKLEEEIRYF